MATAEPNTTPDPSEASGHTIEAVAPSRSDSWWWSVLAGGIIVVAGLVAYANSFHGPFIFDDLASIPGNPTIQELSALGRVLSPPCDTRSVTSRPILNLSLAIDYSLGGECVWVYHATNLAIHLINGLLLLGILRRTFQLPSLRSPCGQAAWGLPLAIALLWTVHPLQTESVTYMIQRAESLGALFYLLVLYSVIRGSQSSWAVSWYVLAVGACFLGIGVKEMVATAPVVVLLFDGLFLGESPGKSLRQRWGLYVGLFASWGFQIGLLARTSLSVLTVEVGSIGAWAYARSQPGVLLHYLRLSVWPDPLCLDYEWPVADTVSAILPGALVVGVLGIATVWGLRKRCGWAFPGAWFFLILAPTSSIMPLPHLAFEHRMYLPLAGVMTLVVVGGYSAGRSLLRWGWCSDRARLAVGISLVTLATVVLGCLTFRRNAVYATELSIWQDTLSKARHARSYYNVGVALQKLGRSPEAIEHYQQAIQLDPEDARYHNNLGFALARAGRLPQAIREYQEAIRLAPEHIEAYNNLGLALAGVGRLPEAIENYQQAIRLEPGYVEAYKNLGNAMANTGRLAEAIEQYEQAIQIDPEDNGGHSNLGAVLADVGRFAEAIEHLGQAIRLNPNDPLAQNNLGRQLARSGRLPEAITHYQQAIRLNPDHAEAHYNLALALMKAGRVAEAIEHGKQAVKGMPNHLPVIRWVAWLMATHEPADPHDLDQAVELAERACTLTGRGDIACLDIVAAAYAAAGQFGKAMTTAQEAWQMARAAGQDSLAQEIHMRLQLYRDRKPYREPVAVSASRNR